MSWRRGLYRVASVLTFGRVVQFRTRRLILHGQGLSVYWPSALPLQSFASVVAFPVFFFSALVFLSLFLFSLTLSLTPHASTQVPFRIFKRGVRWKRHPSPIHQAVRLNTSRSAQLGLRLLLGGGVLCG